ncbi:hypothetical protein [Phenylobacterium soli]|nr:hypothetical protein [Phenylobacterium soli]
MTRALGRRPDETSSPESQRQGPETWTLAVLAIVLVAAIIALVAYAAA